MPKLLALLAGGVALLTGPLAATADEGCSRFLWPLETERAWFTAPDSVVLASGATQPMPPADKAITLDLGPASEIALAATPTSTPKPGDDARFAGVVHFDGISEGHYQVALSAHGWIDVVQNGGALEATAHTGTPDCPGIRKSVRFEIGPGPFSLQVYGVEAPRIRIAVRPAVD